MTLLYGLVVGVAMGWLLQRIQASSPGVIARNLRLEDISIIKFMAVTVAVGSAGIYLLGAFGVPLHLDIKPTYVIGVLVGALVFGVGFALGGYCPGTCVVGAAEGRKDALVAIAGGLVGALVFTVAYRWIEPVLVRPTQLGKITAADALHIPTLVAAIGLAVIIGGAVALIPTRFTSTPSELAGD